MEGLWHRMNIRCTTAGIYPYDNSFTRDVWARVECVNLGYPNPKMEVQKDKASKIRPPLI
jgi:hypothetical protein